MSQRARLPNRRRTATPRRLSCSSSTASLRERFAYAEAWRLRQAPDGAGVAE